MNKTPNNRSRHRQNDHQQNSQNNRDEGQLRGQIKAPQKDKSKPKPASKTLHPNNAHNHGYDFAALIKAHPALKAHVAINKYDNETINFSDPDAVKCLNTALLAHHYGLKNWDIPTGYLCPPVPGRVDYLHYVADMLAHDHGGKQKQTVKLLDIGTGANGIYALLAAKHFGWDVVASDIDEVALANVNKIVNGNHNLNQHLALRHQPNKANIFKDIIQADEQFTVSVCNPPFHASTLDAQISNRLKENNLAKNRNENRNKRKTNFNFGGKAAELWCEGGEEQFLNTMLNESQQFASQCRWFTTLVSKSNLLPDAKVTLRSLNATRIKIMEMQQGNKITRVLAWSFQ